MTKKRYQAVEVRLPPGYSLWFIWDNHKLRWATECPLNTCGINKEIAAIGWENELNSREGENVHE